VPSLGKGGDGDAVDRLFVNLGADGRVLVLTALDGEFPSQAGEPAELNWPMTAAELADLRWYLEDYLHTPFGVYEDRGEQVAHQLSEWGRRVFDAVFRAGPARDAYVMLRTRATGPVPEIVFQSVVPGWLALPWELLRDPWCARPLALAGITVSRRVPGPMATSLRIAHQRLRVLMVISRPRGTGDVGYRMIARPLLEQLAEVQDQVELVVLRPPTLAALTETLLTAKAAGEPFQVVHFDGHGALWGGTGVLVFEKPRGGEDAVPAGDVAEALVGAEVPVVVLNACHSGAIGKELEATVATRLLAGGASSVVAMAYSVYAVAAAKFMTAFYRRLIAGGRVADAVTTGREQLASENKRPSPKGPRPLADWMVPVHYARRDVEFSQRYTPRLNGTATRATPVTGERTDPFEAQGAFVGRDGLFYELEVAARLQRVMLLHGPGGTGKTELAKAFGRWWRDTGAVTEPNLVIWHSFEPGSASFDLQAVLSTIGSRIVGTDFELLTPDKRRERVLKELTARRAMVVWDNVESAHSMPDPTTATPTLDQAGCDELLAFLADVAAGGRSAVLVTSRCPEPWLGHLRRIPITGLSREEANEYTDHLLAGHTKAQQRREDRAFGELIEWLDGHPLSMRLILPQLDTTEPRALLDGLRGLTPLPGDHNDGRTTSLPASITYSIAQLCAKTRRLLVMISLFYGVVDAGVLALFSQQPAVPSRFSDSDLDDWLAVLHEASEVGLLTPLRGSSYAIHPALPAYLVDLWRAEGTNTYATQRAAAHVVLLDAYVAFADWASREIDSGNDAAAQSMIGLHQRNLGDLLGYSLKHQRWPSAESIMRALDRYWAAQGARQEASEWVDLALRRVESAANEPPPLDGLAGSARLDRLVWAEKDKPCEPDSPAGSLWRYLVIIQAHRQLMMGALDSAERSFLKIYETLMAQSGSVQLRRNVAEVCGSLAIIARRRGQANEVENWNRKSRALREEFGNGTRTSLDYHHSGTLAYRRGQLDEAEICYRKSLTMCEDQRNWYGVAANYRKLGAVAHIRGQLDEAETYYLKSRAVTKELANPAHEAMICNYLGSLALERGRLDDAERWYRQSLIIHEKLGLLTNVALCYQGLGAVAQRQGKLDHAEALFRGALTIDEQLGDRSGAARAFEALGRLAEARGRGEEALECMVRSVAAFVELPHLAAQPAVHGLARLTAAQGVGAMERCWQKVTGKSPPAELLNAIENYKQEESA
jgi:tetratricopeptide (TPR) repeat protein